ncbi:helix-turn-helix transcriptional regulator, partial [Streptomyces sp. SID7982]|nr:helix-turn-helix transcriptional regulator [Streptomyces sp. SID7982]
AEFVVTGMSNKEVADRLFVTPASVAFHLGNVYRKLGVRSRYELRRWWAERHCADVSGTVPTGLSASAGRSADR